MSFEVATKRILSDDKFLGHFPCFLGTLCSKARKLKSFLEKFVRPNYSKYPSYKSIQFCLLHRLSQITVGKSNSPHCKYIPGAFEASMQLHAQFLVGESQVSPMVINNPETVQKGKFCPPYGQSQSE